MNFSEREFNGQDITLDNNTFSGCTFRNCRVFFRATGPFNLGPGNHFERSTKWVFDGPAGLTLKFLTQLYQNGGNGGRDLIENTFENIRRGTNDIERE